MTGGQTKKTENCKSVAKRVGNQKKENEKKNHKQEAPKKQKEGETGR